MKDSFFGRQEVACTCSFQEATVSEGATSVYTWSSRILLSTCSLQRVLTRLRFCSSFFVLANASCTCLQFPCLFQRWKSQSFFRERFNSHNSVLLLLYYPGQSFMKLTVSCAEMLNIAQNLSSCRQRQLTRHFSHAHCARLIMWITPHGSSVCMHASPHPHAIHDERLIVPRCFFVLTLSVCLSFTLLFSSHFYLYSDLNSFHVDNAKAIIPCASANRGVLLSGRIHSSHRLWAQAPWRLPLLGDYWNDLPEGIRRQRYGALLLVWRGTRRWDLGKALSSPLFIQESVASSVIFRTLKNGETRART